MQSYAAMKIKVQRRAQALTQSGPLPHKERSLSGLTDRMSLLSCMVGSARIFSQGQAMANTGSCVTRAASDHC